MKNISNNLELKWFANEVSKPIKTFQLTNKLKSNSHFQTKLK